MAKYYHSFEVNLDFKANLSQLKNATKIIQKDVESLSNQLSKGISSHFDKRLSLLSKKAALQEKFINKIQFSAIKDVTSYLNYVEKAIDKLHKENVAINRSLSLKQYKKSLNALSKNLTFLFKDVLHFTEQLSDRSFYDKRISAKNFDRIRKFFNINTKELKDLFLFNRFVTEELDNISKRFYKLYLPKNEQALKKTLFGRRHTIDKDFKFRLSYINLIENFFNNYDEAVQNLYKQIDKVKLNPLKKSDLLKLVDKIDVELVNRFIQGYKQLSGSFPTSKGAQNKIYKEILSSEDFLKNIGFADIKDAFEVDLDNIKVLKKLFTQLDKVFSIFKNNYAIINKETHELVNIINETDKGLLKQYLNSGKYNIVKLPSQFQEAQQKALQEVKILQKLSTQTYHRLKEIVNAWFRAPNSILLELHNVPMMDLFPLLEKHFDTLSDLASKVKKQIKVKKGKYSKGKYSFGDLIDKFKNSFNKNILYPTYKNYYLELVKQLAYNLGGIEQYVRNWISDLQPTELSTFARNPQILTKGIQELYQPFLHVLETLQKKGLLKDIGLSYKKIKDMYNNIISIRGYKGIDEEEAKKYSETIIKTIRDNLISLENLGKVVTNINAPMLDFFVKSFRGNYDSILSYYNKPNYLERIKKILSTKIEKPFGRKIKNILQNLVKNVVNGFIQFSIDKVRSYLFKSSILYTELQGELRYVREKGIDLKEHLLKKDRADLWNYYNQYKDLLLSKIDVYNNSWGAKFSRFINTVGMSKSAFNVVMGYLKRKAPSEQITALRFTEAYVMSSAIIRSALRTWDLLVGKAMEYAKTLENIQYSLGAVFSTVYSVKNVQGELVKGAEAFAIASSVAKDKLKDLLLYASNTSVTFQELMEAFRSVVGLAGAKGYSLEKVIEYIKYGSVAVKSMGLEGVQVKQELRAMLQGRVRPQDLLALSLGISTEDLKRWQSQGKLLDVLINKLKQFTYANEKYITTFKGAWERLEQTIAVGLTPVYKTLVNYFRDLFIQITDYLLVNVGKQVDNLKLNEKFTKIFYKFASFLINIIESIRTLIQNKFFNWLLRFAGRLFGLLSKFYISLKILNLTIKTTVTVFQTLLYWVRFLMVFFTTGIVGGIRSYRTSKLLGKPFYLAIHKAVSDASRRIGIALANVLQLDPKTVKLFGQVGELLGWIGLIIGALVSLGVSILKLGKYLDYSNNLIHKQITLLKNLNTQQKIRLQQSEKELSLRLSYFFERGGLEYLSKQKIDTQEFAKVLSFYQARGLTIAGVKPENIFKYKYKGLFGLQYLYEFFDTIDKMLKRLYIKDSFLIKTIAVVMQVVVGFFEMIGKLANWISEVIFGRKLAEVKAELQNPEAFKRILKGIITNKLQTLFTDVVKTTKEAFFDYFKNSIAFFKETKNFIFDFSKELLVLNNDINDEVNKVKSSVYKINKMIKDYNKSIRDYIQGSELQNIVSVKEFLYKWFEKHKDTLIFKSFKDFYTYVTDFSKVIDEFVNPDVVVEPKVRASYNKMRAFLMVQAQIKSTIDMFTEKLPEFNRFVNELVKSYFDLAQSLVDDLRKTINDIVDYFKIDKLAQLDKALDDLKKKKFNLNKFINVTKKLKELADTSIDNIKKQYDKINDLFYKGKGIYLLNPELFISKITSDMKNSMMNNKYLKEKLEIKYKQAIEFKDKIIRIIFTQFLEDLKNVYKKTFVNKFFDNALYERLKKQLLYKENFYEKIMGSTTYKEIIQNLSSFNEEFYKQYINTYLTIHKKEISGNKGIDFELNAKKYIPLLIKLGKKDIFATVYETMNKFNYYFKQNVKDRSFYQNFNKLNEFIKVYESGNYSKALEFLSEAGKQLKVSLQNVEKSLQGLKGILNEEEIKKYSNIINQRLNELSDNTIKGMDKIYEIYQDYSKMVKEIMKKLSDKERYNRMINEVMNTIRETKVNLENIYKSVNLNLLLAKLLNVDDDFIKFNLTKLSIIEQYSDFIAQNYAKLLGLNEKVGNKIKEYAKQWIEYQTYINQNRNALQNLVNVYENNLLTENEKVSLLNIYKQMYFSTLKDLKALSQKNSEIARLYKQYQMEQRKQLMDLMKQGFYGTKGIVVANVLDFVNNIGDELSDTISQTLQDLLSGNIKNLHEFRKNFAKTFMNEFSKMLADIIKEAFIKPYFKEKLEPIKQLLTNVFKSITGSNNIQSVVSNYKQNQQTLKQILNTNINSVDTTNLLEQTNTEISSITEKITNVFKPFKNNIKNFFTEVVISVLSAFREAIPHFVDSISQLLTYIKKAMSENFSFFLQGIVGGINGLISGIGKFFGSGSGNIGNIGSQIGNWGGLKGATGKFITVGSGIKDDVPILVKKGEYVIRPEAVRKYGLAFLTAINNMALPKYSDGGSVFDPQTFGYGFAVNNSGMFGQYAGQGIASLFGASGMIGGLAGGFGGIIGGTTGSILAYMRNKKLLKSLYNFAKKFQGKTGLESVVNNTWLNSVLSVLQPKNLNIEKPYPHIQNYNSLKNKIDNTNFETLNADNEPSSNLTIINVLDKSTFANYLASAEGRDLIINILKEEKVL